MIIITGTMEVAPGNEDKAKENFAIAAEAAKSERGCIEYRFWQSVSTPTEFRVYEEWEDKGCLKEHSEHPNFKAHGERMAPLGVTNRKLKMIEPDRIKDLAI
ncbi:putative quinol monooxygenase [Pseudooceanicola onchidii]|uniref:putative quinol monooxygenase n=1 Tax=Pseudooceanicola onchidii TaxID=2562279 RepID=UPI00145A2A9C|nr:antibiotic biosynthesis monooxygenase family protein [Pseudooceanicola onchidii]